MKRIVLIVAMALLLWNTGLKAQNTDKDPSKYARRIEVQLKDIIEKTLEALRVRIVGDDTLAISIAGASASGGGLTVTTSNLSVGYDSTIGAWKFYALNFDKYESIAHTVDTSSSTVGANHYEIINMEGYRNLDISVISTDATGMDVKVFRTYDANAGVSDTTTGWYNCTNDFFGSGSTLTLTGTDQAKDGTSPEMMPLKYLVWYSAGAGGNSLDIFTRKHTKR